MKTFKYLILIITGVSFFACSLEEKPNGFLNEENFYKTAGDAESAVLYAYAVFPELGYFSRYYYYVAHCATEEFTQKSDAEAGQHELDNYLTTNTTADLANVFRHCYLTINRTFPIIENVPAISMDEGYKNHIIGEAHFLRAYNYYNLVRLFGEVPLRKKTMTDFNSAGLDLSSIEDIYAYILEDLQAAITLMDIQYRYGRANKTAAQGLLANVHLFLASASESGLTGYGFADVSGNYSLAKQYAGEVVNNQTQFRLDPDIQNIFDPVQNLSPTSSPENIFSIVASRSEIGPTNLMSLLSTPFVQTGFTLIPEQGGHTIDFGWDHVIVETPFYDSFDATDRRKELLFMTSYIDASGNLINTNNDRPYTLKYLDANRSGGEESGNRISIVRYSEVLLTYAEACGNTADGVDALNQVRQRANLSTYTVGDFASDTAFRDAVIQERAWELAFEFNRLFDLRRSGKMGQVLGNAPYNKTLTNGVYFFDIPFNEIDRNPNL
ncbi:RagB/SusD family nutrient uptake outer membrane protein [Flavivirga spongiicola]|uniref:RagB/SusD family nutrient uptake outer membrane protein n=1 Tax=Flavivirga spongiicola TaxID=421621 RepID=A0ABU7XWE7_9FLAO|nr:RagB/SusD family nutrient uptake outer membrane protein [Flavivirga sp. MEBiC05379]MDO5980082.1 RagB/SusD family nutrient uptake outer membrane protein [Flavivirga sp. MEBiC05379]